MAALGHRAIELYVSEEETAKDNDNETALETTKQRVEEERLAESFDKLGLHDGAQYHTVSVLQLAFFWCLPVIN